MLFSLVLSPEYNLEPDCEQPLQTAYADYSGLMQGTSSGANQATGVFTADSSWRIPGVGLRTLENVATPEGADQQPLLTLDLVSQSPMELSMSTFKVSKLPC